jgi:hypothetical protein
MRRRDDLGSRFTPEEALRGAASRGLSVATFAMK